MQRFHIISNLLYTQFIRELVLDHQPVCTLWSSTKYDICWPRMLLELFSLPMILHILTAVNYSRQSEEVCHPNNTRDSPKIDIETHLFDTAFVAHITEQAYSAWNARLTYSPTYILPYQVTAHPSNTTKTLLWKWTIPGSLLNVWIRHKSNRLKWWWTVLCLSLWSDDDDVEPRRQRSRSN